MKRSNNDEIMQDNRNPTCGGMFTSFFCPPSTSSAAPLSGEAFIQTEFENLSADEQERIYRDLYGLDVSAGQMEDEDPSIISRTLNEMKREIDKIRAKDAYEKAVMRCPAYVEKLKVTFLRGDLFNARKAAKRFVRHWEIKAELFGSDCAFSGPVKQSDLDETDMACLTGGGLQILPEKDRGGRTILWARREHVYFQVDENYARSLWYLIMSQLEHDEEAQRNGWVGLIYNVGQFSLNYFSLELYTMLWRAVNVLPIRIVGYHSCYNDLKLRSVVPLTLLFMGKEARARYRCHFGAHTECLFEIMTYGIPLSCLPVSMDGLFDFTAHLDWMERTREMESIVLHEEDCE